MKITLKAVLVMLVALALAVLGGWIWGARGHWRAEDALARAGVGLHLANARGNMLAARVHLFEVNFGDASRSLETAKADLVTAAEGFDRMGLSGRSRRGERGRLARRQRAAAGRQP